MSDMQGEFPSEEGLPEENLSEERLPEESLDPQDTLPSQGEEEFTEMSMESEVPVQSDMSELELEEETHFSSPQVQTLEEEIAEIETSIDEKSYPIGEVPQIHQMDPEASLPLNSDHISTYSHLEDVIEDVEALTREEITMIQKYQKSIDNWEARIERNKAFIEKNKGIIQQNNMEIVYDKQNRDYWWSRAEQVLLDYGTAAAAHRKENWDWLIKKYGYKNPDGTPLESDDSCVDELCNGGSNNLSGEYRGAGAKYDQGKKDKEAQNFRLTSENSKFKSSNEILQNYIQATYKDKIEPLQNGVLVYKELGAKIKNYLSQEDSTFKELREWAEVFLNEFLIENPNTPQQVITEFRRIASIPLPAENS